MVKKIDVSNKVKEKQFELLESNEYFVYIKQRLMESIIREYLKNLRRKLVVWEEIFFSLS